MTIGKGKDRVRYEFGQKAGVVITNKGNWIINVLDIANKTYDGHTLSASILDAEQITKVDIVEVNVDKGYRGHDYKGGAVVRLAGSS